MVPREPRTRLSTHHVLIHMLWGTATLWEIQVSQCPGIFFLWAQHTVYSYNNHQALQKEIILFFCILVPSFTPYYLCHLLNDTGDSFHTKAWTQPKECCKSCPAGSKQHPQHSMQMPKHHERAASSSSSSSALCRPSLAAGFGSGAERRGAWERGRRVLCGEQGGSSVHKCLHATRQRDGQELLERLIHRGLAIEPPTPLSPQLGMRAGRSVPSAVTPKAASKVRHSWHLSPLLLDQRRHLSTFLSFGRVSGA